MTPSPIPRVLSTFRRRKVRSLLMGGQACILYGAAEFTRDIDVAVAVETGNLARLRAALADLKAEPVYFPELSASVLRRGHACHFRCLAPGLHRFRIDVMARMRGVDSFSTLWKRRVKIRLPGLGPVAVLALPDLVKAKKTQRDKDWPMLRRLVEANILRKRENPSTKDVRFWFRECRSPDLLIDLARRYPAEARQAARKRKSVAEAIKKRTRTVTAALRKEEDRERDLDRRYWAPLQRELEQWRLKRRNS